MTEREKFAEKYSHQAGIPVESVKFDAHGTPYVDTPYVTNVIPNAMVQAAYWGWKAAKAQAVPEGWKLVPVEPTPEMMLHGSNCQHHAWNDKECPMRNSRRSIWKHMCDAAPELNKAGAQ